MIQAHQLKMTVAVIRVSKDIARTSIRHNHPLLLSALIVMVG